jgi:Spy/CpxP family protein refolding chaperone
MKPLTKLAVIAVLGVGIFGALAGCGHRFAHKTPQERADWIVKNISDELKLNEAQLGKLNALKDELLAVRGEYRKKHGDVRKTVDELFSQPTLDQTRVLALIKERTQEVNDKAPQVVTAFAAFYDSLTPEQQKKLHDEFAERMERHHGYWHDE